MKKAFTAIIALFAVSATITNAQFILTNNGFVDEKDETRNYVIIEMPGYTQQQLYSTIKTMVTANYISPKTVLSENEPISLCITGTEDVMFNFLPNKFSYNVVYQFKDGKIKFQPKFISLKGQGTDVCLFFNGKPRPVLKNLIARCENVINEIYSKSLTSEIPIDDNW